MNAKSATHVIIIIILLIITMGGTDLIYLSCTANAKESNLWNLQKLESTAKSGDIESQLRLIEFYRMNTNKEGNYKERLAHWEQESKAYAEKNPSEYSSATIKLALENSKRQKQNLEEQESAKKRLQALQEKYEKLGPDAKKNEQAMWMDGLNAIYNTEKIYSWKKTYIWRYRLTVNIETPEGIKSGTTVQEVYYPPADQNIHARSNQGIARGEAAYIDLGQRGVVFMILPDSLNAVNKFKSLMTTTFPTVPTVYEASRHIEVMEHYHGLRGVKDEVLPWNYPMFVRFRDLKTPQSIELVYRRKHGSINDMQQVETDRFEEFFGEGVRIKNITIEMTDDPLEWNLQNKLEWIDTIPEEDITRALRKAEPRIYIMNGIAYYILRQAQQDPWEKIKAEKKSAQDMIGRLSRYKPYKTYDEIPLVYKRQTYYPVTFDEYLERLKKFEPTMTKEMLEEAPRAFVTIDTNRDGKISYDEKKAESDRPKAAF